MLAGAFPNVIFSSSSVLSGGAFILPLFHSPPLFLPATCPVNFHQQKWRSTPLCSKQNVLVQVHVWREPAGRPQPPFSTCKSVSEATQAAKQKRLQTLGKISTASSELADKQGNISSICSIFLPCVDRKHMFDTMEPLLPTMEPTPGESKHFREDCVPASTLHHGIQAFPTTFPRVQGCVRGASWV